MRACRMRVSKAEPETASNDLANACSRHPAAKCTFGSLVLGSHGPLEKTQMTSMVVGLGSSHFRPRLPGSFTLPRRPVETLGGGPRSEPRAPMQMVSGALGSLVVQGLGFRV